MMDAGREQAAITGERLRQANLSYNEIIHSTLDRAVQTAQIIHNYLPSVPLHADEMLVEGGPVPPIPTITYWHLPQKVLNSSSAVARICCEEEQSSKLGHGALTVDFRAGCSSCSMTNSFLTNAVLIERAVSC